LAALRPVCQLRVRWKRIQTPIRKHRSKATSSLPAPPVNLCPSLHAKFDSGLAKKCLVLERRWRLAPVVTMSQVHVTGCAAAGFGGELGPRQRGPTGLGQISFCWNHNFWMVAKPSPQPKLDEARPVVVGVGGTVGRVRAGSRRE